MKFRKTAEEPTIEFITSVNGAVELVPPVPMRKAMPNWMKQTPFTCPVPRGPHGPPPLPDGTPAPGPHPGAPKTMPTVRSCAGLLDIMKWGYMIPLWCDHNVTTFPDSHQTGMHNVDAPIAEVMVGAFAHELHEKMPRPQGEYGFSVKIDSPWLIRTPPGWSTALLPLPYGDMEFKQPWRILPGIIDTDRYHNFNVLLGWSYEGEYLMEQGTPLCVVVPFKRDTTEIPMRLSQVSEEEVYSLKASGKGGIGSGNRYIKMPYQRHRKAVDSNSLF